MKEKPILFNTEMVQAILEGRKTQTRRVIKPQPKIDKTGNLIWGKWNYGQNTIGPHIYNVIKKCPYGKIGDRLWVRETWKATQQYPAPGNFAEKIKVEYRAGGEAWFEKGKWKSPFRLTEVWRPSIHMFRWSSRINLEITNIRVERVQEISEEDAKAEGIELSCALYGYPCYKKTFHELWDSINKKRGYSWDSNPWVWVVEFKRQQ